jgi:HD-like signal output (HDOD) protein
MAMVVAGIVLVVLIAGLIGLRRQQAAPVQSRARAHAHTLPEEEEQAQALAQALGQSDEALLWSALENAGQPVPLVAVEGPAVAQARTRLQAGALSGQALPRRPQLLPQLMVALNDPGSTASKLAGIIGQDPVLAATLMRIANSAAHRRRLQPLESLERVVVKVGQEGLERLLSSALVQPVLALEERELRGFASTLWRHGRLASAAAADHARIVERIDPLPLQLGSLLPALSCLLVLRALPALADQPLDAADRLQLLMSSQYVVAAEISRRWELPEALAQALEGTPGQMHASLQFGRRMAWAWMQVEDGLIQADQARQALSAHASAHAVDWVWQRLSVIQENS